MTKQPPDSPGLVIVVHLQLPSLFTNATKTALFFEEILEILRA